MHKRKRSSMSNFRVMYEGIHHISEGEYQGMKWWVQTKRNVCYILLLLQTAAFGHTGLSSILRNHANYLFFPQGFAMCFPYWFCTSEDKFKKAMGYLKRILIFFLVFPENETVKQNKITDIYRFFCLGLIFIWALTHLIWVSEFPILIPKGNQRQWMTQICSWHIWRAMNWGSPQKEQNFNK